MAELKSITLDNVTLNNGDELFIVPIDYSTLTQNTQYPEYDLKTGDLLTPYTYDEILAEQTAGKTIVACVKNFWGSGYPDTGFLAPMNKVNNSFLAYYPFADWDNTEYDMCYLTITIRKSGTDTKVDVQYDNFGNPNKKQYVAQGDWLYKINPDNTFEAVYSKAGVEVAIQDGSGAFYRSANRSLTLPTGITDTYNATIKHADVQVMHNNYPVIGTVSNIATTPNVITYYALSGSSRNTNPNYTVTAHVFGTLVAK